MYKINEHYLELPGSYLFSRVRQKVEAFSASHPGTDIISLGIGDVTLPLAPSVIRALHGAVDEMSCQETFRGYAPDLGYAFLREAISTQDFQNRGAQISPDEIFISDGAKSDAANIGDIFSADNTVAVCDPVYPVYLDSSVMAGRAGTYRPEDGRFSKIIYLPCTEENRFVPELPKEAPDLIWLCSPNNPTGMTIPKAELQRWVDYALANGSLILYDAAYEAYIREEGVAHTIYECEGAASCAVELRSFSKNAGFTGLRLGYTVVPKELKCGGVSLHALWARRHGTKFNGAPYIVQRAGEAVYSPEGRAETASQVDYYMKNASLILEGLREAGYTAYGGVNAPYIWLKTPAGLGSWEFFDRLLEQAGVVGTPGEGFGPCGEGFLRLTAFGTADDTAEAVERIRRL